MRGLPEGNITVGLNQDCKVFDNLPIGKQDTGPYIHIIEQCLIYQLSMNNLITYFSHNILMVYRESKLKLYILITVIFYIHKIKIFSFKIGTIKWTDVCTNNEFLKSIHLEFQSYIQKIKVTETFTQFVMTVNSSLSLRYYDKKVGYYLNLL